MAGSPTIDLWQHYQAAFDYFNGKLFEDSLQPCILNFSCKGRSRGYFIPHRWRQGEGDCTHEISLNPALLSRPVDEVMAMLVRLMVSLWQYQQGTPGKAGYFDQEWAAKMEEVGLIPSDTGQPGGKKTGYRVWHLIDPGGSFAAALKEMPQDYFPWRGETPMRAIPSSKDKITYVCPKCGTKFWGREGISAICMTLDCDTPFEAQPAVALLP
jgi:hypothetical protein